VVHAPAMPLENPCSTCLVHFYLHFSGSALLCMLPATDALQGGRLKHQLAAVNSTLQLNELHKQFVDFHGKCAVDDALEHPCVHSNR